MDEGTDLGWADRRESWRGKRVVPMLLYLSKVCSGATAGSHTAHSAKIELEVHNSSNHDGQREPITDNEIAQTFPTNIYLN